jgi:hypothetical protein
MAHLRERRELLDAQNPGDADLLAGLLPELERAAKPFPCESFDAVLSLGRHDDRTGRAGARRDAVRAHQ